MPRTPEELQRQRIILEDLVHSFCNQRTEPWLAKPTSFPDFKKGKIGQIKCHLFSLPPPAKATCLDRFTTKLHEYITFSHFNPVPTYFDAYTAVRKQVEKDTEPMQTLLDIVVEHYEK